MAGQGRGIRIALIAVAAVLVLIIGGVAIVLATFDPNSQKPRIITAVKQATGRDLALNGPIGVKLSLVPTLEVRDAALANPPGFSRPEMVRLQRLDVQLAILPLLRGRIEIAELRLLKPDILLETDAQGHPNWNFTPEARPAQPATPSSSGAKAAPNVAIGDVSVTGAVLAYRDGRNGQQTTLAISSLTAQAGPGGMPLHVTAAASYNDMPLTLKLDSGAAADQPMRIEISGKKGDAPFALSGTFGPLAGSAPMSVDLLLKAVGAQLAAKGQIADAEHQTGVAFHLDASVPDMQALAPFTGAGLPPVKDLKLAADVADAPGGLAKGVAVKNLTLAAPGTDIAGTVSVGFGQPMAVTANVTAGAVDVRPWMAGAPAPAPAPAAPAGKPAAPRPREGHPIPDTPLPFGTLQTTDADITARINELQTGDATYKAIDLHLLLKDGVLKLDPFAAESPDGHVAGTLSVDAGEKVPPVRLTLQAPGLALRPLLAALKQPAYAAGNLEVQADLRGAGETPHAIAGSLDGHLGLALANGTVDNRLIAGLLGSILEKVNTLDILGRGNGTGALRCLAARLDFQHGVGTLKTLQLSSTLLTMGGTGSVDLGSETLALRLTPQGRLGSVNVSVPVRVTGPLAAPSTAVDSAGTAEANAGAVAGAVIGNATPIGIVGGLLGADKLVTGGGGDVCAGPLAIARGGEAPASAAPAEPQQGKPAPANPANMLKSLFR